MEYNLADLFEHAVDNFGDREYVVAEGRRRTYAQWYTEIRAVAGALRAMGLKPGDHLVVVMRNRYEMATLYWACHLLGAIFTPVSWRATREEIAYCLEDAEAVAPSRCSSSRLASTSRSAGSRRPTAWSTTACA